MKVTYKNEQIEESKYPYFGEDSDEDGRIVVMLTKDSTGMVVFDTTNTHGLYHIAEDWDEESFKKLDNFSVTFSVP